MAKIGGFIRVGQTPSVPQTDVYFAGWPGLRDLLEMLLIILLLQDKALSFSLPFLSLHFHSLKGMANA